MVTTKVEVYEKNILLTGLYGLNNDDPNFYDQDCITLTLRPKHFLADKNPIKFARLDFFHIFIEPGFQSDHSIIGIEKDFIRVKLGRGFF